MPAAALEAFTAELGALDKIVSVAPQLSLRDEKLRDRFRTLFLTWSFVVEPKIGPLLPSRRELYKLTAEVEALAKLASKIRPYAAYRMRLKRAWLLAKKLALYVPTGRVAARGAQPRAPAGAELFVAGIPDLRVSLVPNAILGWRTGIEQFVKQYPFDRSIFVMIRYRKRNVGLIKAVKNEVAAANHTAILASEHSITDDLYNPIACLLCCARGLAIFDRPEPEQDFNPNVAYELGMMHLLGRECRILKHADLTVLHTDILMKLYRPFQNAGEVRAHVREWLPQTSSAR